MEKNPPEATSESSFYSDAGPEGSHVAGDPRTTATLPQPPSPQPPQVLDQGGRNEGDETRPPRSRSRSGESREPASLPGQGGLGAEEPHGRRDSLLSLGPPPHSSSVKLYPEEQDSYVKVEKERSSSSLRSFEILMHTPHRAYWAEQQNRLPLPLMELMEEEVLEILTSALKTYRSGIGRRHFMTKELQRYIEGLKKRRSKMLCCMPE